MKISLENLGKRYQRLWVFKELNACYSSGGKYAVLGRNGSGKSSLMRILAGIQNPSAGLIKFEIQNQTITKDEVFRQISFCAPGMDLPDELTLEEFFAFHFTYKKPLHGLKQADIIKMTGLSRFANKPIADYSSGMRQRVKLAQAFFSDTQLLLLDEPCTNLDESGVGQYLEWVYNYTAGRTLIVASNDEREYSFADSTMLMSDYKG